MRLLLCCRDGRGNKISRVIVLSGLGSRHLPGVLTVLLEELGMAALGMGLARPAPDWEEFLDWLAGRQPTLAAGDMTAELVEI